MPNEFVMNSANIDPDNIVSYYEWNDFDFIVILERGYQGLPEAVDGADSMAEASRMRKEYDYPDLNDHFIFDNS